MNVIPFSASLLERCRHQQVHHKQDFSILRHFSFLDEEKDRQTDRILGRLIDRQTTRSPSAEATHNDKLTTQARIDMYKLPPPSHNLKPGHRGVLLCTLLLFKKQVLSSTTTSQPPIKPAVHQTIFNS